MAHPHLFTRAASSRQESLRAVVYVQAPELLANVEKALELTNIIVQNARSIDELVAALIEDPPPRPQLLISDFDSLTAAEVMQLHTLRSRGWFGRIFALGRCPLALRSSLGVDRVFSHPVPAHHIRTALDPETHSGPTMRFARVVTG
jgi:hypothetical protein